ncbi:MAG: hypothetical protein WBF17_25635, partial [Phycisphaerae bacterium]
GGGSVGVVSHVKVLSDKVPDVSSLAAWKGSFIKPGMSDRDKALAVWRSVVMFQHQDNPPSEYLQLENSVLDPLKIFNVYGYSYCSVASADVQALARFAGLKARGWTINRHLVPEVFWDGAWHMLDASLINHFPKPDGRIAGVEEIVEGVKAWYAGHPGLKGNDAALRKFMRDGGWKKGPGVLANCPFYDRNGWLPAATHGWYSTMQEYDGSTLFAYESGYSVGYQVNVQLRRGERLTRNWSNKGLHVMMPEKQAPGCLTGQIGKGALRYCPGYGDLAPGRVGNGTLEYDVPLADGAFRLGALAAENLACRAEARGGAAVHVKDASKPARLVIRMPSSYVYLTGKLVFEPKLRAAGRISVELSTNNGLDWRELLTVSIAGDHVAVQEVDLTPLVFRRYDYRLRFIMRGEGTGLNALRIVHDIQHSQRALPALGRGSNTITFSAGPPEGTVTIEGSTDAKNGTRQLLYTDFHPRRQNIRDNLLVLAQGSGAVTFPIETPGEMTRVRVGIFFRARDRRDAWDVQVSFDDGKTFRSIGRCEGPTRNDGGYFELGDVPPGTKKALARFVGTQRNTTMIYNLRIDADYAEPHGGFLPVKITYVWKEGDLGQRNVQVAAGPAKTYTIT